MRDAGARRHRLLGLLQDGERLSGPALAEHFDVTARTIRGDVEYLRRGGHVIEAVPGVHGGYRMAKARALSAWFLHEEEAVAMATSLAMALSTCVEEESEALLRALLKVELLMPPGLSRQVTRGQQRDQDRVAIADWRTLVSLARACLERRRLTFQYVDVDGYHSRRDVQPQRVLNLGGKWYLLAYDATARRWSTFRAEAVRMARLNRMARRRFPERVPPLLDRDNIEALLVDRQPPRPTSYRLVGGMPEHPF